MPADQPGDALPNRASMAEDAEPQQLRLEPVQCPHCDQVTMPNLLADRSAVCSCPAERSLPADLLPGGRAMAVAAPMDEAGLGGSARESAGPPRLPEDHGQFGRDVATEAFAPLARPPSR